MIERTTVRLPVDLLRRAKRKAADEGRTLTALIEEGLRTVVADQVKPQRKRISLPVSRATGGLMPGIDLADRHAIDEIDDLEYVAKLKQGG